MEKRRAEPRGAAGGGCAAARRTLGGSAGRSESSGRAWSRRRSSRREGRTSSSGGGSEEEQQEMDKSHQERRANIGSTVRRIEAARREEQRPAAAHLAELRDRGLAQAHPRHPEAGVAAAAGQGGLALGVGHEGLAVVLLEDIPHLPAGGAEGAAFVLRWRRRWRKQGKGGGEAGAATEEAAAAAAAAATRIHHRADMSRYSSASGSAERGERTVKTRSTPQASHGPFATTSSSSWAGLEKPEHRTWRSCMARLRNAGSKRSVKALGMRIGDSCGGSRRSERGISG